MLLFTVGPYDDDPPNKTSPAIIHLTSTASSIVLNSS
jgi:hypothetical protein